MKILRVGSFCLHKKQVKSLFVNDAQSPKNRGCAILSTAFFKVLLVTYTGVNDNKTTLASDTFERSIKII